MYRLIPSVWTLLLIFSTLIWSTFSFAQTTRLQFDSFFSIHQPDQINGALLLAQKGSTVYEKAFGKADFNSGLPNTSLTAFNLASVSKVITATAVLQLLERGKLRLSDPVLQHLSDFPYPQITIRHLLTHTSGLPNLELYEDLVALYPDTVITNANLVPALKLWKKPLPFAPGDKWQYCNTNFDLLALVIEKLSGLSYAQYLKRCIFDPVGMKSSFVATRPIGRKGVTAHVLPNWYTDKYIPADSVARYRYINYNLGGLAGATNIITTLQDLFAFDKAVFSHKLLKKETLALAHTPVKLNDGSIFYEGSMDTMLGEGKGSYGMGWSLYEQPGFGKSVGHGGYNYGLATFYFHHMEPDQTIIAFDNTAGRGFGKVVTSALNLLNNKKGWESISKTSLARIYGTALKEKGIEEATVLFNNLKADTSQYYTSERELNWLGYDFLRANFEGHLQLALEVFKINSILYPISFNVYDSYAEALLKSGRKDLAMLMYQKSLDINPENRGAKEALGKIMKE